MTVSTEPNHLLLVIDDEQDIQELVTAILTRAGYRVMQAGDGRQGLALLHKHRPDLVILDVMLPGLDGWRTLERIRDFSDVPVLMLTARSTELEKVRGLRTGADDFVTKPFGRQELVARVSALLRRSLPTTESSIYVDDVLYIDFARPLVTVNKQEIELTALELRLLAALVRQPGEALSPETLLQRVWGGRTTSKNEVKLYISYLRHKLYGTTHNTPIVTVRGHGYRYEPARTAKKA